MASNLFNSDLWFSVGLSLSCGLLSALFSVPWGIFWGWVFARKNFEGKIILQTILYLPLVLPPVLTGYFLLSIFGRHAFLGKCLLELFRLSFVLNWKGALLASFVVGSPFMIEAMRQAFLNVDERFETVARSLGADSYKAFKTITLPLAKSGIVTGFFLVFARSVGEFGATIILAGNIPGKTQTIPLAIYSKVYSGQENSAWPLIIFAVIFAYAGLALSNYCHRSKQIEDRK